LSHVFCSFANFEACIPESVQSEFETMDRTRAIFERAYTSLKMQELSEERLLLLEAWKEFEISRAEDPDSSEAVANVIRKFPKRVRKRRPVTLADGTASTDHFEEYYHYIFPDDAGEAPHLKLLAMAHQWKKQQQQQ
jgi:crooked neck